MDWRTPSFPVLHHFPELAQTHVHWVGDAIQISCPVIAFSSCPQSFPVSGSFPMSNFFALCGQSVGAPSSAPVLPMNIQGWFPLGLTGLISLLSKGLSGVFCSITIWKHQFFHTQPSLWSSFTSICHYWGKKTELWLYGPLLAKWCLCFLKCCLGFYIAILPRS